MEVQFTDSFYKSLKKVIWQESKIYKTYSLFRYDLPRFFSNIWRFRKGLWSHHWWDHHGLLKFMEDGLIHMSNRLEKDGIEVDISRLKKVEKIRRAIQLIQNYNNDSYLEMAEKELGDFIYYPWEFEKDLDNPGVSCLVEKETKEEKEHNRKLIQRSRDIGESEWNELWDIFKGQDYSKIPNDGNWEDWFDGTGIRGWWD